jgi:hypothetical protein
MGIAVELRCGGELGHDLVSRLEQARSRQTRSARPATAGCSSRRPFDGIEEEFTAATDELRERRFGI